MTLTSPDPQPPGPEWPGQDQSLSVLFRIFRFVLVLAVAVAVAFLLYKLKKEPKKKEIVQTPPSVTVMTAAPVSKVMIVSAFGTVKARKSVKIAAEVTGRIKSIHPSFTEGGFIPKGAVLIKIDPDDYQLEKEAARVRVDQAVTDIENLKQDIKNLKNDIVLSKANLDLAQKELDRMKTLTGNQFASVNSLEKTEQQYLAAKMQDQNLSNRLLLTDTMMEQKESALAMARVNFKKAELALSRTSIKMDFNGFVLEKMTEKGEFINPGQTLGIVYEKGKLDVDVSIPMEKVQWFAGRSENKSLPRARVRMVNGSCVDSPVRQGRVVRLNAGIDEKTRTLPLTIEIEPEPGGNSSGPELKPGAFAACDILGETIENVYVVPRYLLKTGNILFSVHNNRLKMKPVTILRKFEEQIYITDGLTPGEKIVSSPLPGAQDGMAVSIRENGK